MINRTGRTATTDETTRQQSPNGNLLNTSFKPSEGGGVNQPQPASHIQGPSLGNSANSQPNQRQSLFSFKKLLEPVTSLLNWCGQTVIDFTIGKSVSSLIAINSAPLAVSLLTATSASISPVVVPVVALISLAMTFGGSYNASENQRYDSTLLNCFKAFGVGQLFGTLSYFVGAPQLALIGAPLFYYLFCPTRTSVNNLFSLKSYSQCGTYMVKAAQALISVVAWPFKSLWRSITTNNTSPTT
jgi:hypothetical protein